MKYYTGIGSRDVPTIVNKVLIELGTKLALAGYCLRSGGADGCDTAFQQGVENSGVQISKYQEIYLPWDNFNGMRANSSLGYLVPKTNSLATELTHKHHPRGNQLRPGVLKLMNRNAFQILGSDMNTPSDFVVCYATNPRFDYKDRIYDVAGGTGQAVRIAYSLGIEVFNIIHEPHLNRVIQLINK